MLLLTINIPQIRRPNSQANRNCGMKAGPPFTESESGKTSRAETMGPRTAMNSRRSNANPRWQHRVEVIHVHGRCTLRRGWRLVQGANAAELRHAGGRIFFGSRRRRAPSFFGCDHAGRLASQYIVDSTSGSLKQSGVAGHGRGGHTERYRPANDSASDISSLACDLIKSFGRRPEGQGQAP